MMQSIKAISGGGTPVFVQSTKVMFTADGQFRTDTNWSTYDQSTTNGALVNQLGVSIPWKITVPTLDDWDIDGYPGNVGSGDFSVTALSKVVYCYMQGASKTITISGLNASNTYKIRAAALYYADPIAENKTNVTVNGITKQLLLTDANTPYEVSFDASGSTSISLTISAGSGAAYALISAIILEEYTTS